MEFGVNGGLFDSSMKGRSPNGDVTLRPLMNRRNDLIYHNAIFGWGKYIYGNIVKGKEVYWSRMDLETYTLERVDGVKNSSSYVPVNNDNNGKIHYTVNYRPESYRKINSLDLETKVNTIVVSSTDASKFNASTLYNGCIYSRSYGNATTCNFEKADLATGITTRIVINMPTGIQGSDFGKSITPIGDGRFYITCAYSIDGTTPSVPRPVTLVIWNELDNSVKIVHKDIPIEYLYDEVENSYYKQHFNAQYSFLVDDFLFLPTNIVKDSSYDYFNIPVLDIARGKFTIVYETDDRLRGLSMTTTDSGIMGCFDLGGYKNWYKMFTHTY